MDFDCIDSSPLPFHLLYKYGIVPDNPCILRKNHYFHIFLSNQSMQTMKNNISMWSTHYLA